MKKFLLASILVAVVAMPALIATAPRAAAKEYILVGTKPNVLALVDPAARKIVRQFEIPGEGSPYTIDSSPDGKIGYVLSEHWGAISGIDLDSGKEVFRATLSSGDERVRAVGGFAVSRDGSELYVQESPTKLLPAEYQVQPTRIAVYKTDAGLEAKPVRTFEIPRVVFLVVPSVDGKLLYLIGQDIYVYDATKGTQVQTLNVLHWAHPNASPADVLVVWPYYEQSEVFSTPFYYTRTDLKPDDPEAGRTGILTLDLRTGDMQMKDVEPTTVGMYTSVINPVDHNEAFGVMTTISKIDLSKPTVVKRVEAPHSYYVINISSNGKEFYIGGTQNDIGIYSTATLQRTGGVSFAADMSVASLRIIQR